MYVGKLHMKPPPCLQRLCVNAHMIAQNSTIYRKCVKIETKYKFYDIVKIYRLFAAPSPPTHLVYKITGGPFNPATTDRRYWNYTITWKVGYYLNISIEYYYIILCVYTI